MVSLVRIFLLGRLFISLHLPVGHLFFKVFVAGFLYNIMLGSI